MQNPFALLGELFQTSAAEFVGLWLAAVLTLIVYSYLFSDNLLFKLAQYLFVGVAAGYALVVAWHGTLVPRFVAFFEVPLEQLDLLLWIILGLLFLFRRIPSVKWLSKIPVAYLFGVGAALAVGGALTGSIVPQLGASLVSLAPDEWGGGQTGIELALYQGLLLIGTLGTLLYFFFTTTEGSPLPGFWVRIARVWGGFGKWIIMITFGAIFGSLVMSRISLLLSRIQFLAGEWLGLIP
jgi:hypothetical protein